MIPAPLRFRVRRAKDDGHHFPPRTVFGQFRVARRSLPVAVSSEETRPGITRV